ncbi:MAG: hypothetical protein R6U32_05355 [Candidatus Woesearchaeota archaeon]
MGGSGSNDRTEHNIISLFKEKPDSELSTSYIVRSLFPERFREIDSALKSPSHDRERIRKAKAEVAKLHRKTLYYLNKLQDEDIIKLSREGGKGRKFFSLALNEGEELHINNRVKKIFVSRQDIGSVPVEGYEQKNIIYRFDPSTWISRVNSILVESARFKSLDYLHKSILRFFNNVNDVVGLYRFNLLLEDSSTSDFAEFIEKIDSDCEDFGRSVCLIIKVRDISTDKAANVIGCIRVYSEIQPKHVRIVFESSSRDMQKQRGFFGQIIPLFSESKIKLYVKDDSIHSPPYIIGRGGPHTFDEAEWSSYTSSFSGKMGCIVCSQASFAIDIHKLLNEYRSTEQASSIVMKIAKSLFFSSIRQRRRSGEYFNELNRFNRGYERSLFNFSRNYIRLWNHLSERIVPDGGSVNSIIGQLKDEVNSFCHSQETIYNASGMPTRFRIAFSCAFDDFRRGMMNPEMFTKIIIRSREDLHSEENSSLLTKREEISGSLGGGNRVRLYRKGNVDPSEVVREMLIVMNTYQLPLICYDFGDVKGANLQLNSFFD